MLNDINLKALRNKLESRIENAEVRIQSELFNKMVGTQAAQGKTVKQIYASYCCVVVMFTDWTYFAAELDGDQLDTGVPEIQVAKLLELVDPDSLQALHEAELALATLKQEDTDRAALQRIVNRLGKERVRELL